MIEQGAIRKLRTWPWRTETASGVGMAYLLPLIVWITQRLLTRLASDISGFIHVARFQGIDTTSWNSAIIEATGGRFQTTAWS